MSILSICSIAFMTRFAFSVSLSCNCLPKMDGMTCHDTPNLSCSQPHLSFLPPAESLSHSSSPSCCVSQFTKHDSAGLKLHCGPPFNAKNSCPSSVHVP